MSVDLIQGSPEWHLARLGKVTGSRVAKAVARTKTGWSADRARLMNVLIAERLTGEPEEVYETAPMRWGKEKESEAAALYEFRTGEELSEIGFVPHPTISMAGASPDRLVGSVGLVEFKAPNTTTHLETIYSGVVPPEHLPQITWQLACRPEREWCDFASFDPRLEDAHLRLWIARVYRDDDAISALEADVRQFIEELEAKLAKIRAYGNLAEAA